MEFIDSRFQTIPDRRYRAVCGFSMGGYGAVHLAFSYPERFGAAVSMSGALDFGHVDPGEPAEDLPKELVEGPAGRAGPSPHPDPLGTAQRWPLRLVRPGQPAAGRAAPRPADRLRTEDHFLISNRAFHAHLQSIGYEHEYAEYPGGHTWEYWDEHVKDAIDFIVRTLGWPAGARRGVREEERTGEVRDRQGLRKPSRLEMRSRSVLRAVGVGRCHGCVRWWWSALAVPMCWS